jgi:FtsP/CotA-like multicopper oxidase with cupredoxin domain
MIARERDAGDVQDVVVMLHDFAFRSPQEILGELVKSKVHGGHSSAGKSMAGTDGQSMKSTHANDVQYDAFLANDRTLDDPEVVRVEKGGRIRLRIINGGTATAFFITTPGLSSRCIAVDGSSCRPIEQIDYPLAPGQRIDLLVEIPREGGAFPILAQVEAERMRTGIVLTTVGATLERLTALSVTPQGMAGLALESQLLATSPSATAQPDNVFTLNLGEEPGYRWTINSRVHGEHEPVDVRMGERVEMTFVNPSSMMHPMHLHGHHFQVVAIGSKRFLGAIRDTVIVPPQVPVTIAFDATKVGSWYLHCHHLYHMASGMMTEVRVS